MNNKRNLVEKIKGINRNYSDEQATEIAILIITLSELYYEIEVKNKVNK